MGLYHLNVGKHLGDYTDPKTGVVDPNHVYTPGSVVSDDKVDLAATFPEKFSYLGQRPGVGNVPETADTLEAQANELQKRAAHLRKEAAAAPKPGAPTVTVPVKAVDDMTEAELKAFCEDEEIDLSKFKPKHPGNPKLAHDEKVAFVKAQVGGK